ncbi:SOS response-associated peptidase [bacterium]|nr:MAG: SOS response-associated peptidase [bacterium]
MAPGQLLGAVVSQQGNRVFRGFRWGLIPAWWSEEQRQKQRLFAARAENLTRRPSFNRALRQKRAVVPVDGFWMWHEVDEVQIPFYFRSRNGEPLFLAALWDDSDDEDRLALVSVEANRIVEPLGARMPAILRGDAVDVWLDENVTDQKQLVRVLQTVPSNAFRVVAADPLASSWKSLEEAPRGRDWMSLVYGREFRPEKPRFKARRRLVRRDHLAGGQLFFRTRSFTRDDATQWHPIIDIENGHVFCDCPDFRYRHAQHEPDVWTPQWWCKHVSRAVANCKSHGELPVRELV